MHCNLQSPDVTPSVVHTKFEVGHSIHSWLITILLLIPYVTLWPWPLTFWPWMFAVYRPWRDQPLEQIVAKSNNLRLSYSDLFIEHLGATPPILDFTIVNINYCAIALDSQRTQTPNFSEIKQLIVELSVMAILILFQFGGRSSFRFNRKWIFTMLRPTGTNMRNQHIKLYHNPATCGCVIDDLSSFFCQFFVGFKIFKYRHTLIQKVLGRTKPNLETT